MAKNETLSDDLDLVREIEELKLKQRLLVESLKKKQKQTNSKELTELTSKIDFLVEIFKNATEEEQKETDDHVDKKLEELSEKLEKRFDAIDKKLTEISSKEPPKFELGEEKKDEPVEVEDTSSNLPPGMKDEKGNKLTSDSTEKSSEDTKKLDEVVASSGDKKGVFSQLKNGFKK